MHELALMESLVTAVEEQVEAPRVVAVHLQVGELTCVAADALRFCFDVCVRGTRLEGAELCIESIPARLRCERCGPVAASEGLAGMCACGSAEVDVLEGRELRVRGVEVV
jgi:hydrogenase nickel incorporation protein HypA/HybF